MKLVSLGNEHTEPEEFLMSLDKDIYSNKTFMENAVLVVSVDRNFAISSFSNRPEDVWKYDEEAGGSPWTDQKKQMVMENTISTLGADVVGLNGPGQFDTRSGTSYAAPAASGALALVQGMGEQVGIEL